MYIINQKFKTYESDIRALLNSFFPGEELIFTEGLDEAELSSGNSESKAHEKNSRTIPYDNDTYGFGNAEGTVVKVPESINIDLICANALRSPNRFEDKSAVKKSLYIYLCELTGRNLPWGTVTGIRPVRLIERYEDSLFAEEAETVLGSASTVRGSIKSQITIQNNAAHKTENDIGTDSATNRIEDMLCSKFLISEEKSKLLARIYNNEKKALSAFDYKNGMSIYLGIPFCPSKCVYCSFTSYPFQLWEHRIDEYIDAVKYELIAISKDVRRRIDTIYIGGGTPSVLSAETIDRLLSLMEEILDLSLLREFTFEAGRPDTISTEKLRILKKHKVDRISINPQTMNEPTLRAIGRRHSIDDIIKSFHTARDLGFDNINMDIIAGLPGEGIGEFEHTLNEIEKLDPDNLTVHTLAIKRASALNISGKAWGGVERKGLDQAGMEEMSEMIRHGAKYAIRNGMQPYYIYRQKNMAGSQENTGYAKPGKESLYNILMMEEKHTVMGAGAGSSTKIVSYDDNGKRTVKRFANVKNVEEYIKRMNERMYSY